MNETITGEALDLIVFADDCKCEVEHRRTTCTYEVVARYSDCEYDMLICAGFRDVAVKLIQEANALTQCATCDRYAHDCWKVIPV